MEKLNFNKLKKPYFIAEIGGNHAGSEKFALEGILNAKKAKADCVKFQMYKSDELVTKVMPVMHHVKKTSNDKFQHERFTKLEITEDDVISYSKLCKKIKIHLSVTPFYPECIKFLSKYVNFFKIASGDIDFYPMIELISKQKKPVVVSTGMSNSKEVKEILKILKNNQVVLLHCISSYPTLEENLNLNSFLNLKKFGKTIGFSDHTKDYLGAIMSLSFGAKVFEKHFLPNSKIKNVGDYKLSLNPKEMQNYIETINKCFKALGKVRQTFFESEKPFYNSLRRSLYFKKNLPKNHIISKKDIIFLRPYSKKGVNKKLFKKLIGKKLKKTVFTDQVIESKMIK